MKCSPKVNVSLRTQKKIWNTVSKSPCRLTGILRKGNSEAGYWTGRDVLEVVCCFVPRKDFHVSIPLGVLLLSSASHPSCFWNPQRIVSDQNQWQRGSVACASEAFLGVSSLKEGDLIEQTTLYATNYCLSAPEWVEAWVIQNTTWALQLMPIALSYRFFHYEYLLCNIRCFAVNFFFFKVSHIWTESKISKS